MYHRYEKPEKPSSTSNYPTFRCTTCKETHEILGSKQKRSKVTNKLLRYCKSCWEKKVG